MKETVVEFDRVSKTYTEEFRRDRTVQALRDVSFTIKSGQVFALLGPNRAGKTTLVKILLTLCKATTGTVRRFGAPVEDRSTLGRVGFMHENQAFPRYLTAQGLLEYYGALSLIPEKVVRERAVALLQRVGLADRDREPIARFSKGMIQRLALAQALLNEPDLLVLDEPTEGLDLDGRRLVQDVVAEVRALGKTVLLVSHVLTEVETLCDQAAVIVEGRLAYHGRLADLIPTGGVLEAGLRRLYHTEADLPGVSA